MLIADFRCMLVLAGMCMFAPSSHAQQLERDYSKYVRPFLFVLPKPVPLEKSDASPRKYSALLNVNADGTVQVPVEVVPHDPAMVAAVNEVAHLWLFYPDMTSDCKPAKRIGRIGFEYADGAEGRAWVEFPALTGMSQAARAIAAESFSNGLPPDYPRAELLRRIQGKVFVAMKLLADGTTAEHVVYFAAPRAKGLMQSALNHARWYSVKFDEPIQRSYICATVPYEFKLE